MINKKLIIEHAVYVKDKIRPSIYILLDGDEIVYVGRSVNPYNRIGVHLSNKKFDQFTILNNKHFSMDVKNFDALYPYLEEYLIIKFNPKYNKNIDCLVYISSKMIKKEYGIGAWERRRLVSEHGISGYELHGLIYYARNDIQNAIDNRNEVENVS